MSLLVSFVAFTASTLYSVNAASLDKVRTHPNKLDIPILWSVSEADIADMEYLEHADDLRSRGHLWASYAALSNASDCRGDCKTFFCIGRSYILAKMYQELGMAQTACKHVQEVLRISPLHDGAIILSNTVCPKSFVSKRVNDYESIQKLLDSTTIVKARTWEFLEENLYWAGKEPRCLPLLLNIGAMFHMRGLHGYALKYYTEVLMIHPAHALTLSNVNSLWSSSTIPIFFHDGITSFYSNNVLLPLAPEALTQCRDKTTEALQHGDRYRALAKLMIAAAYGPIDPTLYNNLGVVQYQLGNFEAAIAAFERASLLQPLLAQPLNNIATVLQTQSKNEVALGYFDRALRVDPYDATARYNLGNTLLQMDRVDDTILFYWDTFDLKLFLNWKKNDLLHLVTLESISSLVGVLLLELKHSNTTCIQEVLKTQFQVPFQSLTSLGSLLERTLHYDRSWNVLALALHSKGNVRNIQDTYNLVHKACASQNDHVKREDKPFVQLIVQYFIATSKERQDEIDAALRLNIGNPHIARIHVLLEKTLNTIDQFHNYSKQLHGYSKLKIVIVNKRLTFRTAFGYISEEAHNQNNTIWAICNADIYFDESLSYVRSRPPLSNQVIALTRWQYGAKTHEVSFWPRIDSQDAWLLTSDSLPEQVLVQSDYPLGYLRSDTRLVSILTTFNVSVINWGFHVKAIHLHESTARSYTQQNTAWGDDAYLHLSVL
ncbi:hypothetical protein AeRB84_020024 [Aphanomyces euteiches]|nr:hypothetical protein AeRB84_020024 [Aphanomyces euteiches]